VPPAERLQRSPVAGLQTPGGPALPPVLQHGWFLRSARQSEQLLTERALLTLRLVGQDGRDIVYAVDVRNVGSQGSLEGRAHLFVDGRHHAQSKLPAVFPVEGGTIEVAQSAYGLRRAHYVAADGAEQQLTPDPKSAAGRRLRLDRRHPVASRILGGVSVVLLVAGVGLNLLQLLEPISAIPPLVQRFGQFESPIHLPLWLNLALGIGAGLAATERALRLRYTPLLDGAGA
jgi:hypothetical protein